MGARARGFLLFSFAFSSVLSSPEIAVPLNEVQTKSYVETSNNNTNINVAINRDCLREGSCSRDHFSAGNIEKREISYRREELNGEDVPLTVNRDLRMNGEIEKRARVGFTGMRGKKGSYSPEWEENGNGFLDYLEKRSRMGFTGMRGKKYDDSYGKRGQMGFMGMRGKKSDDTEYEDGDALAYLAQNGGGRRGFDGPTWDKRTMAFHGMRGRRSEDEPALAKRIPYPFATNDDSGYDIKRALGFMGMRGKKTPEMWSWYDYGKRENPSGFFGMKGKKAQSGFFGMRGKKSTSDFFGVPAEGELNNEVNTINGVKQSTSSQERVRRGINWLKNSKKAKNAFFAVRGKKSSLDENGWN